MRKIVAAFLLVGMWLSAIQSYSQCSTVPVEEAVRNGDFELGYLPGPNIAAGGPVAPSHTFTPGGPLDFDSDLGYAGFWNGPTSACKYSIGDQYGVGRVEPVACLNGAEEMVYGQYAGARANYKDHTTGTKNGFSLVIDFNSSSGGVYKTAWKQKVNVYPSQMYYFSAWFAQYGSNTVPQLRFRVEALNGSGGVIDNQILGAATPSIAYTWQQFSSTYATPVGAVQANIYIECISTGLANSEDFLIDDISFINGCQNIAGNRKPSFSSSSVNLCTSSAGSLNLTATYPSPGDPADPNPGNNTVTWFYAATVGATQTQVATGTSLSHTASTPGIYRVCVQDPNNGCATSATIVVEKTMTADLPASVNLCSPAVVNLTPAVTPTGAYTKNYVWSVPSGATNPGNAATASATRAGAYSVTVSNPNVTGCTATDNVNVTSSLPTAPTNLTYCAGGGTATTLTVGDGKSYSWYTTAAKTTLIGTGVSVPWTPAAGTNGDQTLYIVNASTSPLAGSPLQTAAFAWEAAPNAMTITVTQTVSLRSVNISRAGWAGTGNVTVNLSGAQTRSTTVSVAAGEQTVTLNWLLSPGTYTINYTGSGSIIASAMTATSIAGYVSISGTSNFPFRNMVFEQSEACDPIPVVVKAQSCCTPPTNALAITQSGSPYLICGTSGTLNATIGGSLTGLRMQWFNGTTAIGSPAAATASPSLNVTADGTYTLRIASSDAQLTQSGCYKPASLTVNIEPIPGTPTAGSNSPLCVGSTLNLTSNTVAGATYAWTGPGGYTSSSEDPTRASATAAMSGTYSVTVTVNGCVSTAGTTNVVVNPIPATPTASSNSPICAGSTLNLTANTVAGATYAWTGPGGYTSSSEDPTRASATSAMSGTYSVTVTVNGCTSTAGTTNVVVNPIPTAPTAGSNSPVCVGSTLNLTSNTVAGATYTWTGPGGYTSSSEDPTRASATAAMSGTYSVTVTVNGCVSTAGTTNVVVNPIPATPTASSNSPICAGSTLNLTANTVAGATYAWTGPGGYTSSSEDPTRASATSAMSGTYSVTVTVNGCTSTAGTTNVVVNPIPTAPTAGSNSPVCEGSTINLTANTVAGATYAWTGPGGYTSSSEDPTRASATAAMSGTYSVTVTVNGCTSTAGTTNVVVNTNPVATITTTGAALQYCAGGSGVTLTASPLPGATYEWFLGGVSQGAASGSNSRTNSVAGNWTVRVSVNGCSTTSSAVTVVQTPAPAAGLAVSAVTPICSNANGQVTITASESGVSYQAYIGSTAVGSPVNSTGGTINLTIPSATLSLGANTITIRANKAGCNEVTLTNSASITVNSGASATVSAITGANSVCPGAVENYSVTAVGGITYNWSVSGGGTIANGATSSPTVTWNSAGNWILTCTPSNTCGAGTSSTLAVTVNPTPTITNTTLSETICSGSASTAVTLTSDVTGTTFSWTATATGSVTGFTPSASNTTSIPAQTLTNGGTTQGSVSYVITARTPAGCNSTASKTYVINVDPAAVATVSQTTVGTCNAVQTLPGNPAPTGTVTWVKIAGAGTIANPSLYNSDVTGMLAGESGTFQMTVTSGVCEVKSPIVTVTRSSDETPIVSLSADKTVLCEGSPVTFTANGNGGNLSTRTFEFFNGATSVQGPSASNTYTVSPTASLNIKVVMVANSTCLASGASNTPESSVVTVTVDQQPDAPVFATPATSPYVVCSTTQPIALNPITNGTVTWSITNGGVPTPATGASTTASSLVQGNSYTVTASVVNGTCITPKTASVTLNVAGNVTATVSPATLPALCEGQSLNLTATVTGAGSSPAIEWFKDGNGTGTTTSPLTIGTTTLSDAGTYELRVTSACGVTPSNQVVVTINAAAIATLAVSDDQACAGEDAELIVETQSGVNYQPYINGSPAGNAVTGNGLNIPVSVSGAVLVPGTNNVVIQAQGCNTVDLQDIAIVTVLAKADELSGDSKVCGGEAGAIPYTINPIAGATEYIWTGTNGVIVSSPTTSPAVLANFNNINSSSEVSTTISVTPTYVNGATIFSCETKTKTVTWRPAYNGATIAGKEPRICVDEIIGLELSNTNANGFSWSPSDVNAVKTTITGLYSADFHFTQAGTYTINISPSAHPCKVLADSIVTVTVYPRPVANAGNDDYLENYATVNLDGSGSSQGPEYTYHWSSPNANPGIANPNVISTTASPKSLETVYFLTVGYTDPNLAGCSSQDDKRVIIDLKVETPNVFSPNGDGIHDLFELPNIEIFPKAVLYIYNQWGEHIFTSQPGYTNPWDGRRNNKACTVGTYYYILELNEDGYKPITGAVSIVR